MKEGSKSGLVIAFAIGVFLAFLSTWVWTPPWIEPPPPPPPPPGIGAPITHTTYERSSGTVTVTDSGTNVHPYTYVSDADASAAYLIASQPSAQWTSDTVTFALLTDVAAGANLTATNVQLFYSKPSGQKHEVLFEPFGSTVTGDEITNRFDNTRYADARTLANVIKHSEMAPTRLSLSQPMNSRTLTVTFTLP